tara:strand:+ start:62 stop:658 length:597 start_codon:yes stop_codon:yes gene_type:complete
MRTKVVPVVNNGYALYPGFKTSNPDTQGAIMSVVGALEENNTQVCDIAFFYGDQSVDRMIRQGYLYFEESIAQPSTQPMLDVMGYAFNFQTPGIGGIHRIKEAPFGNDIQILVSTTYDLLADQIVLIRSSFNPPTKVELKGSGDYIVNYLDGSTESLDLSATLTGSYTWEPSGNGGVMEPFQLNPVAGTEGDVLIITY